MGWNPTWEQIKGVVRTTLLIIIFAIGYCSGKTITENKYMKIDLTETKQVVDNLNALGEASSQQVSKEQTIYVKAQPVIERIITSPSNCSDDDYGLFNTLIRTEQLSTTDEMLPTEGD